MTTAAVFTALAFFLMPAPTVLFDATQTPIVTLPAGYFVCEDKSAAQIDGYTSVIYDDIKGYVRSSDVSAVDYTPVTKYETTVTFSCDNDGQPVNLRKAPKRSAEILTVLDSNASGRCYGELGGEALIAGAGDKWYYCAYGDLRGYCYRAHVNVSDTPPNIIEKEPPDTEPSSELSAEPEGPEEPEQALSKTAAIIFIVALCIPVPFVMFYLFKKPKDGSQP